MTTLAPAFYASFTLGMPLPLQRGVATPMLFRPLIKARSVKSPGGRCYKMDAEMPLCLFCPTELDATTKPEHILLNALGGRKTTKEAICSSCNNTFGGTIDDELASQVMALRNLLQLESGSGDVAPSLKKIQAGKHKINIKGDGTIELVDKPFTIEQLEDGQWNVQIRARSGEHLAEIVPHLAKALKIPEENLRAQLGGAQASLITGRPGVVRHNLRLGGPHAIRSAMKACLVLWSTLVGNDEVKSVPYDAGRKFVLDGDEQFLRNRTHIDSRQFDDVERMKAAYGLLFNMIYVRSDGLGRVIGHFTLYNAIAWQVTLAEAGGTPNAKVALISNPLDPRHWSDRAAEEFDVPFVWLDSPDYSDQFVRSKARFDAILRHYFETNMPKERTRIVDECFEQLGITPNESAPSNKVGELSSLITSRITHHAFGLPEEQKLSPDQIAALVKKK
ncbi:MAG: HNH endonuclease [Methylocella sp.]